MTDKRCVALAKNKPYMKLLTMMAVGILVWYSNRSANQNFTNNYSGGYGISQTGALIQRWGAILLFWPFFAQADMKLKTIRTEGAHLSSTPPITHPPHPMHQWIIQKSKRVKTAKISKFSPILNDWPITSQNDL